LQPLRGATTLITADAGYQSEANLRALDTMSVEALIADRDMRQRDERFATQARHQQGPHRLRAQCLRTPATTPVCYVAFLHGRIDTDGPTYTARMQARLDAPEGREAYGRRFATVEPVFFNLRANKRLDRFTLRGREKVNGQWTLYCLAHNIGKLAHAGYARREHRRTRSNTRNSTRNRR